MRPAACNGDSPALLNNSVFIFKIIATPSRSRVKQLVPFEVCSFLQGVGIYSEKPMYFKIITAPSRVSGKIACPVWGSLRPRYAAGAGWESH